MEDVGQAGDNQGPIVWSNAMSAFVLKYLAELVASGAKTGKGFKSSHMNACSRALVDHFKVQVNGMQINHHLKKWRNRWSKISDLKKIDGTNWDEETKSIVMDHDRYMRHIMKHKKDANFINTPLMYYDELATIFTNRMASGAYAKSSTEPIAPDATQDMDTTTDNNGSAEHLSNNDDITNNAPNGSVGECSCTKPPNQHKRARDEENLLDSISRSLTKLAETIEKIGKNDEVPDGLWHRVSVLPGFSEADLTHYFTYLSDNPKKARAFMKVPMSNQKMMAARFLRDNP